MTTCVVIPVFGRWTMALRAVEHVATSSVSVVVVDDASVERDPEAEARILGCGAELIRRSTNGGFAAAVNTGLQRSPGGTDVVAILNSDVLLDAETLEEVARRVRRFGGIRSPSMMDETGVPLPTARRWPTVTRLLAEFLVPLRAIPQLDRNLRDFDLAASSSPGPVPVEWLTGACLVLGSGDVSRLGPLDEGYGMYVEEVDWQRRAAGLGIERWFDADLRAVHLRGHIERDGDASRRFERLWASRFRYVMRWHGPSAAITLRMGMILIVLAVTPAWAIGAVAPRWRGMMLRQLASHWHVALRWGHTRTDG